MIDFVNEKRLLLDSRCYIAFDDFIEEYQLACHEIGEIVHINISKYEEGFKESNDSN